MAADATRIVADHRWEGEHGIARFAREVLARLDDWAPLALRGKPARPLEPWRLMTALRRQPHNVFFNPGFIPPLRTDRPFVFAIHDLIHLDVKEEAGPARRAYYRWVIKPAVHRAFRIVTVSEHARSRIAAWSGAPKENITVVGNGVSEAFTPIGPAHNAPPYLLYVGNHKFHKNIAGLLRAFASIHQQAGLTLLFAGKEHAPTVALAQRLGVGSFVSFSGSVSDDTLATMYRGAVALVMPSFAEGFGLPALEAMACGTAVICSDTTSLPALVGDAGLLVSPSDPDQLSAAMCRIARDDALRQTLRERGLRRAAEYSWAKVADRVRIVLDEASAAAEQPVAARMS